MNDYRITYTTEAGDSFDSIITERTEAAARKFFTSMNKGLGFTVASIELHRENTCATKQQERDALAAIRRMVEELGPQSYLSTAFEGVFEDAESNIENDFGDSMKARWQDAEKRVAQVVQEAAEIRDKLQQEIREKQQAREEAKAAIREAERRADRAIKTAEDDANFYRDKVLDSDDLTDLAQLVEDKLAAIEETVNTGACCIVAAAEHPESELFQNAVRDHRNAQRKLEYYQALAQRIKHAQGQ